MIDPREALVVLAIAGAVLLVGYIKTEAVHLAHKTKCAALHLVHKSCPQQESK